MKKQPNKQNEEDELNVTSFRITLNSLKQDLFLLERFEENKYYQDFIIEQIKQYKQEKNDKILSNSIIPLEKNELDNNNNNTNFNNNDDISINNNHNNNNTIDLFDLILKNVNIDEIDEDYIYIREIDNELCLKDINSNTPINTSSNKEDNENFSDENNKDNGNNNNNNNIGNNNQDNKDIKILNLKDQDEEDDDYSNSSIDDIKDENSNKENEENQIKKEIRENKKKMIKKIIELRSHDETFNEAFKFIEINKWLKTKGLDIISDKGTIETDLIECMNQLQSKIDELNLLINNNNNNNNNIYNSSSLSSNINNNTDNDEDVK